MLNEFHGLPAHVLLVHVVVAAVLWYLGWRYDYGLFPDKRAPKDEPADTEDDGAGSTLTAVRTQPRTSRTALPRLTSAAIALVAFFAVANVIQLYRIGDAGAQAVWHGSIH